MNQFLVVNDTNIIIGLINIPNVSMQSNTLINAMNTPQPVNEPTPVTAPINVPTNPMILSTLTDDMFVVETPSFNVPFVYEKPPKKSFKEFVDNIVKIKNTKSDEDENQYEESLNKKNENNQKENCNTKLDTYENMDVNELENEVSCYKNKLDGSRENSDGQMFVDKSERSKKIDPESKNVSGVIDLNKIYSITHLTIDSDKNKADVKSKLQSSNYFENPLGKFFIQIGLDLVQEHVKLDLLRTQKKKNNHKDDKYPKEVQISNNSLVKTLDVNKKNNDLLQFGLKMCELCDFKSESSLVIARHLDISHETANIGFRCNIFGFQEGSSHEILQHMNIHNIKRCLKKVNTLHQCPNCLFEIDNKGKFNKHLIFCSKRYQPKINQAPLLDWEPPAKIPRVLQNKSSMDSSLDYSIYQEVMSRFKQFYNLHLQQLQQQQQCNKTVIVSDVSADGHTILPRQQFPRMELPQIILPKQTSEGILLNNTSIEPINQPDIILTPDLMNNHTHQVTTSTTQQPLSFPLDSTHSTHVSTISKSKPHHTQSSSTSTNDKSTFKMCEICDDYMINSKKLHEHMQFTHKVKFNSKLEMGFELRITCPICQLKFFTDKGLERHLLGSYGLVTLRLIKAAKKYKDGGRCPVCHINFPRALLNHVSSDHSLSLNTIKLSYKCNECILKFLTSKNYENHMLLKHSNIAINTN